MKKFLLLTVCCFLLAEISNAKIYKGAEYRTKEAFTYGRFEVRMKSAQRVGMLSSFFTYHEIANISEWNEIDIEILGRYEKSIQFNPITRGQVNHESHYLPSFNPALDYHTYAFEWTPAYVAWFVDGVEVHRQTGAHIEGLNLPQKIMMNIWNPTYANWAGTWNENILPAFAYYDWVQYSSYTPGAGNHGTNGNFTIQWKDDFDAWDQTRWDKASHTFNGNACDFLPANVVFQDGKMILCLTKETLTGYLDVTPPDIEYARLEHDGVLVSFSEEVDSVSASTISNYIILNKTIESIEFFPSQKQAKVRIKGNDTSGVTNIIATNIKDRWKTPNTLTVKNVNVIRSSGVTFPLKINCGGPSYKSYLKDQEWGPAVEYGWMNANTYSNTNTYSGTDPEVFNTELNNIVKYFVRVPNGTYAVFLMMSENYFTEAGKRTFSISVQGNTVEENLDLFAKIGYAKPYQKIVSNVLVTNGILELHFTNVTDRALMNGIQIYQISTGINERIDEGTHGWMVGQNYPNPFNGNTVIPFHLSQDDIVILEIYDSIGRHIETKHLGQLTSGDHVTRWDSAPKALPSGIYYYVLRNSISRKVGSMVLLK